MTKYSIIKEEDLKIEKNMYSMFFSEMDVPMYAVKLTHIPTNLQVVIHTDKSFLDAYNSGIERLELKLKALEEGYY